MANSSNRVLELTIAESCASPNRVGVCVLTASPHGYDCKAELIQLRGGTFRVTVSTPFGSSRRTVRLGLDLRAELGALRRENAGRLRRTLPWDDSRGRVMHLYLAAGTEGEWVACQSPLIDRTYSDSAIDRIFHAIFPAAPDRESAEPKAP